MIIVSRIIHVKVDGRLNVANKFKYQRRLSSRLAIVMFRGTPCSRKLIEKLSRRHLINSSDAFVIKGFTVGTQIKLSTKKWLLIVLKRDLIVR